jgi:hypothetical protein
MFLAALLLPIALILLISFLVDRRRRARRSFYPEHHVTEDAEGQMSPDVLTGIRHIPHK